MIELRSDTCSMPDEEMRQAMCGAALGNETWGEDPTVNLLVQRACQITGKEAGLFMASGTMANLVALLTHGDQYPSGSEVIVPEFAHTYWYEAAGISRLAGLSVRTVDCSQEFMPLDRLAAAVRPNSVHAPQSALLWVENTYMLGGGIAIPLEKMEQLYLFAHDRGISVHLDGARIFNAAAALGTEVREIAQYADSVQFCFSKGLGAPFGSVLCGDRLFIQRARHNRTMVGGGMRQAGMMAAAALVGLSRAKSQIPKDHEHAQQLARGLNKLFPGSVDLSRTHTNLVLFDAGKAGMTQEEFCGYLKQNDILAMTVPTANGTACRFVLYNGISTEDVDTVLRVSERLLSKL